jgi:hypothetical protein
VPILHIDGGEKTNTVQIHSFAHGGERFFHHVFEPSRPSAAKSAGFADDHRSAVSFPDSFHQIAKQQNTVIVRIERGVRTLLAIFHLSERIIISADNVQNYRCAAKFRIFFSAENISRQKSVGKSFVFSSFR